jgi:hypothetical protein
MVHDEAFSAQQHVEPAIAKAPTLLGERPQPFAQSHVVDPARSITHCHPHAADHQTRPPLAHLVRLTEISEGSRLAAGSPFFCQKILQRGVIGIDVSGDFVEIARRNIKVSEKRLLAKST